VAISKPKDDESELPSVITKALRISLVTSLAYCLPLLVLAALWQRFMPIENAWLRSLSSLILLLLPIGFVVAFIPRLANSITSTMTQITEALENVAIGRLEFELPAPKVKEVARMNTALLVMLRRLRASMIQLERAAQEDSLTQLYNRAHFKSKVEPLLHNDGTCAMLLLDLDRFKAVNETIGHAGGDRLLTLFAERVRVVLAKYGTGDDAAHAPIIARLGGDEFAICLGGNEGTSAVAHVAQRLLKAVEEPFNIDGNAICIGVSIGIALAPQDGDSYELLTRNADLALFQAKHLGKQNYQFFNEALKRQALAKHSIESQLRAAIVQEEFEIHYQPQLLAKNLSLVGVEALVRWQHPMFGLLLPDKFIGVAEECGLIGDIGRLVLRSAVMQAASWHRQGRGLRVSVNIAAIQLRNNDFSTHIRQLLVEFALPAWLLELELTETIAMQDTQDVHQQLIELRAMGVTLAIDDFGTGYSNLALLRRLEFDRLKIDRSFVSGIETQEDARMIVSTILAMAHAMNVEIVAEGVETSRQVTILTAAGCTILQGFHFSKALPIAELENWWAGHIATSPKTHIALGQVA
jgi:diguanylate cyclase